MKQEDIMRIHFNAATGLPYYNGVTCSNLENACNQNNYLEKCWGTSEQWEKEGFFIPDEKINNFVQIWNRNGQIEKLYNIEDVEIVKHAAKELEQNWIRLCNQ